MVAELPCRMELHPRAHAGQRLAERLRKGVHCRLVETWRFLLDQLPEELHHFREAFVEESEYRRWKFVGAFHAFAIMPDSRGNHESRSDNGTENDTGHHRNPA